MGDIFRVAKISNIFWGCLKFLILFWGEWLLLGPSLPMKKKMKVPRWGRTNHIVENLIIWLIYVSFYCFTAHTCIQYGVQPTPNVLSWIPKTMNDLWARKTTHRQQISCVPM